MGAEKLFDLARIATTGAELTLGPILVYMDRLEALDLSGVEPLTRPDGASNVWREDVVRPSLPRDEALRGAPETDGAFFIIPAITTERGQRISSA